MTELTVDYTNHAFREYPEQYIWYALRTSEAASSKQESKIVDTFIRYLRERNLLDQLIEVFIPKQTIVTVKRNKKVTEDKNFFPGHIFICIDKSKDIAPDISRFIHKNGMKPYVFSQQEIDKMKAQVTQFTAKPETSIDLDVNTRVRIINGVYTDMKGIVEKINLENDTVLVKLDIFGGTIPAEVNIFHVAKDE